MTDRADPRESDLREAVAMLAAGSPDCIRVADALDAWLAADDSTSFEAALSVGNGWRGSLRRKRRDSIIAKIAREHFYAFTGRRLAAAIVDAIGRYEAGEYRHHRKGGHRPPGLAGDLFDLLECGVPMLGPDALRSALAFLIALEKPRPAVSSRKRTGSHGCSRY